MERLAAATTVAEQNAQRTAVAVVTVAARSEGAISARRVEVPCKQADAYSMDMQEIYGAGGGSSADIGGHNTLSQASTHNPMLSPHHNPMLYGGGYNDNGQDDGELHTPVGPYSAQNDPYGSTGHHFDSKDPFDYSLGDSVHNPLASNPVLEMQKRLSVRNSVVGKKRPVRRTTMSQSQVSHSATKSFISMDANS